MTFELSKEKLFFAQSKVKYVAKKVELDHGERWGRCYVGVYGNINLQIMKNTIHGVPNREDSQEAGA